MVEHAAKLGADAYADGYVGGFRKRWNLETQIAAANLPEAHFGFGIPKSPNIMRVRLPFGLILAADISQDSSLWQSTDSHEQRF